MTVLIPKLSFQQKRFTHNEILRACLIIIFFCGLGGCQEDPISEKEINGKTKSERIRDGIADEVSKSLASSMNLKGMRSFLKEEATKQFDGDYDILFNKVKNKPVSYTTEDSRTQTTKFSDLLFNNAGATNARTAESKTNLLESIQKHYPLLQISIPALSAADAEHWDIEKVKPLVAVLESSYDESKTKTIKAYDWQGNTRT